MIYQMDYTGESFVCTWENHHLKIRALRMNSMNALGLLKIILDAAISDGPFKISWDLRDLQRPSVLQWFEIISFVNEHSSALNRQTKKLGMLVSPRMCRIVTYAIKMSPPTCSYLVTSECKELKFFMRDI